MKKTTIILGAVFLFTAIIPILTSATAGENKSAVFLHHSTGEIYVNGGMRTKLEAAGYTLKADWYDGDTDVADWYSQFNSSEAWDFIGDNDIVIFKSCFPNSDIYKGQLAEYKDYYRSLYEIYEAYPDVLFVPMSTPPLPKAMTSYKRAKRAKKFDKWLNNNYVKQYSGDNLWPFRLHKQLRNKRGYLKSKYVDDSYDGHPKSNSGKKVGKKLVKRLNKYFAN